MPCIANFSTFVYKTVYKQVFGTNSLTREGSDGLRRRKGFAESELDELDDELV
jgi:hypothetical protein